MTFSNKSSRYQDNLKGSIVYKPYIWFVDALYTEPNANNQATASCYGWVFVRSYLKSSNVHGVVAAWQAPFKFPQPLLINDSRFQDLLLSWRKER